MPQASAEAIRQWHDDIRPDIPQVYRAEIGALPVRVPPSVRPPSALPMRVPSIDMAAVVESADVNFLLHHGSTQIEAALAGLRGLAIFKIGLTAL